MSAILNWKICDHASACDVRKVCPTQALNYNENTKRIEIDNEKCISCGLCERTCPIGAIAVARSKEEELEILHAIEEDPRSSEDLFVDRYGADIINEDVVIDIDQIDQLIKSEDCLIEILNENNIMCLLKSIPYNDIIADSEYKKYYRCLIDDNEDVHKYNIVEFPSLLVCKNGKIEKIINGYFEQSDQEKFFDLIKDKA